MLPELLGSNDAHVVFDLHGVTFMDACGLGVLVDTQRRAALGGGRVCLVAPSVPARKLLTLAGSDHVFPTFDSLEAAVSAPGT